jgi:hypothetical protein
MLKSKWMHHEINSLDHIRWTVSRVVRCLLKVEALPAAMVWASRKAFTQRDNA